MKYVVAGQHSWNKYWFTKHLSKLPGDWYYVSTTEELVDTLNKVYPQYIFFLHWSDIVSPDITDYYECVCFHPTALPFGRGGTPIQNLILRGFKDTKLTAFKMIQQLDAGPIYLQKDLSLSGSLQEIFTKEMIIACKMIEEIIRTLPTPAPQVGEGVEFKRRKPEDSKIIEHCDIGKLYDQIRMVDAEDYPLAYIEYGGYRFEFTDTILYNDHIEASVIIKEL